MCQRSCRLQIYTKILPGALGRKRLTMEFQWTCIPSPGDAGCLSLGASHEPRPTWRSKCYSLVLFCVLRSSCLRPAGFTDPRASICPAQTNVLQASTLRVHVRCGLREPLSKPQENLVETHVALCARNARAGACGIWVLHFEARGCPVTPWRRCQTETQFDDHLQANRVLGSFGALEKIWIVVGKFHTCVTQISDIFYVQTSCLISTSKHLSPSENTSTSAESSTSKIVSTSAFFSRVPFHHYCLVCGLCDFFTKLILHNLREEMQPTTKQESNMVQ